MSEYKKPSLDDELPALGYDAMQSSSSLDIATDAPTLQQEEEQEEEQEGQGHAASHRSIVDRSRAPSMQLHGYVKQSLRSLSRCSVARAND